MKHKRILIMLLVVAQGIQAVFWDRFFTQKENQKKDFDLELNDDPKWEKIDLTEKDGRQVVSFQEVKLNDLKGDDDGEIVNLQSSSNPYANFQIVDKDEVEKTDDKNQITNRNDYENSFEERLFLQEEIIKTVGILKQDLNFLKQSSDVIADTQLMKYLENILKALDIVILRLELDIDISKEKILSSKRLKDYEISLNFIISDYNRIFAINNNKIEG